MISIEDVKTLSAKVKKAIDNYYESAESPKLKDFESIAPTAKDVYKGLINGMLNALGFDEWADMVTTETIKNDDINSAQLSSYGIELVNMTLDFIQTNLINNSNKRREARKAGEVNNDQ